MSTARNKEVVSKLIEAHIRNQAGPVKEILSPKLVWHMAGSPGPMGRDDYLEGLTMGASAFADMAHTVHDLIGEGDKVVTRTTVRLRHVGEFMGIPASHREIEFESLWMYRVIDQKVVEIWGFDEDFTPKLR